VPLRTVSLRVLRAVIAAAISEIWFSNAGWPFRLFDNYERHAVLKLKGSTEA